MRGYQIHLRNTLCGCLMFVSFGLSGCGNACFVGFSNNGNGGVIVKAGNPPPTCSFSQGTGMMSAVVLKSPACESCPTSDRLKHVWVTLRSIQIHPSGIADTNPADWIELAPDLADEPRQIDLMDNSEPVPLVESSIVPAGSYDEVRLKFATKSEGNINELTTDNACRGTLWNCVLRENGHVEALRLSGGVPELVIHSSQIESDSVLVLPNTRIELRLSLEPNQVTHFSESEGWSPQTTLVGRAAFVRQDVPEAGNWTPIRLPQHIEFGHSIASVSDKDTGEVGHKRSNHRSGY
jgi:Domain of unknown function (DUF4382)